MWVITEYWVELCVLGSYVTYFIYSSVYNVNVKFPIIPPPSFLPW